MDNMLSLISRLEPNWHLTKGINFGYRYIEFNNSMVFLADKATHEPEWDNTYSNKLHF